MDDIITKMLNIARSYIRREDIKGVNDIQSHHRYVIMKESDTESGPTKVDDVMPDILSSSTDIEFVVDSEESMDNGRFSNNLYNKFGRNHVVRHVSIIGDVVMLSQLYIKDSFITVHL